MAPNFLRHILVEGCFNVDHLALVRLCMENREIHNEGIALALDDILCDHLVAPWINNLAKVDALGQDVRLNVVVSDFAGVQLHNKVFFEGAHGIVLLEMCKDLLGADCNLAVDHIAPKLILSLLLLQ